MNENVSTLKRKSKPTLRIGTETGSVVNWIKSANPTAPVVGDGATYLMWTDRQAFTVISVSADGKNVSIQRDRAIRTDQNGLSESQDYDYQRDEKGKVVNLVRRQGCWRQISEEIVLTDEFSARLDALTAEARSQAVEGLFRDGDLRLVEGKTRIKKRYPKFSISFGERNEYDDPCF